MGPSHVPASRELHAHPCVSCQLSIASWNSSEPTQVQQWSDAICIFSGCIMPIMASSGQGSKRLNAQLLVDSIPALIHTARPDGYRDYFNKPWLEYSLGES
jgi:hypothetical protein